MAIHHQQKENLDRKERLKTAFLKKKFRKEKKVP